MTNSFNTLHKQKKHQTQKVKRNHSPPCNDSSGGQSAVYLFSFATEGPRLGCRHVPTRAGMSKKSIFFLLMLYGFGTGIIYNKINQILAVKTLMRALCCCCYCVPTPSCGLTGVMTIICSAPDTCSNTPPFSVSHPQTHMPKPTATRFPCDVIFSFPASQHIEMTSFL